MYSKDNIEFNCRGRIQMTGKEGVVFGEPEEIPESKSTENCETKVISANALGTCNYYKFRFNDFLKRHSRCWHTPPDYYYGQMREIEGGFGIVDTIKEWWTPTLEKEMKNEIVPTIKRRGRTLKPIPSTSYGYKYCVRFTKILMPQLSNRGQNWLKKAKLNLQIMMESGIINHEFVSAYNLEFNSKYNLMDNYNRKIFYTNIELKNMVFREFAFATHPDAYIDSGLLSLPIADKIKISMTPDFKEWGSGKTWEQALIVMQEQIEHYINKAKNGLNSVKEELKRAIQEAESYLKVLKEVHDVWEKANQELEKYRGIPWLN